MVNWLFSINTTWQVSYFKNLLCSKWLNVSYNLFILFKYLLRFIFFLCLILSNLCFWSGHWLCFSFFYSCLYATLVKTTFSRFPYRKLRFLATLLLRPPSLPHPNTLTPLPPFLSSLPQADKMPLGTRPDVPKDSDWFFLGSYAPLRSLGSAI